MLNKKFTHFIPLNKVSLYQIDTSHASSKIRVNALQMLMQMQQEMSEIKCTVFPRKVESCQFSSESSDLNTVNKTLLDIS